LHRAEICRRSFRLRCAPPASSTTTMRLSLFALAAAALPFVAADDRRIESKSLNPCMSNSSFSATLFNVVFTPNNRSLAFNIEGISNIAGKVEADLELLVYGYSALNQVLDPCGNSDLEGMCPMNSGPLTIKSNLDISQEIMGSVPGKQRQLHTMHPH
jgi:hypothetical protein